MKNLKEIGKILNKNEQRMINGGNSGLGMSCDFDSDCCVGLPLDPFAAQEVVCRNTICVSI